MQVSKLNSSKVLRMTIGAAPHGGLNLNNEIRLVKAAILYADHVTLCSPSAFLINSISSIRELNDAETFATLIPTMLQLEPKLEQQFLPLMSLLELMHGSRAERRSIPKSMRGDLARFMSEIRELFINISNDAGLPSIEKAIKSGLLEVRKFNSNDLGDGMVQEYFDFLTTAVTSGDTYPLLDKQSGSLIRAGLQEGKFTTSQSAIERGKQVNLASYLFDRLPLFDSATVDEVLDIRRELERPLIRFRAGVMDFSKEIGNAAWDKDFSNDAEEVFLRKVEPTILDIEDSIKSSGHLFKLAEGITSLAPGSLVAMILDRFAASDTISTIAGLGTAAAVVLAQTYKDRQKSNLDVEKNHLFFYYKLRQKLN